MATVSVLPVLFALPPALSQNAVEDSEKGSSHPGIKGACLPAFMAGLLAGSSTDFELVQLYRKGVFRKDPYGVRYYTDSDGNTGLRVRWATD